MAQYICQLPDCYKHFYSAKCLISHMTLMHSENSRMGLVCGIGHCNYFYNSVETFRKHLRLSHTDHWDGPISCPKSTDNDEHGDYIGDIADDSEHAFVESDEEDSFNTFVSHFGKRLAFFKLKITEGYLLAKSVSQSIFSDIRDMFDIFERELLDVIKKKLKRNGIDVSFDDVFFRENSCDSIFDMASAKFNSEHKFVKYMTENLKLVRPITISTNSSSSSELAPEKPIISTPVEYQYIPILSTIKNYLEQPDVWASCQQTLTHSSNTLLSSYTDGKIWADKSFANNPNFFRIHLYSDELELANPIGSRKTVHKMSVFYFIVGNIETKHWSKLSNIHLALLCKYKHAKFLTYDEILKPLLADVRQFETDGIELQIDGQVKLVYGSIVSVSGDNLTSHALGGFNSCFSSGRVCRYCMTTKMSLTNIYCEDQCTLRTLEGHLYHLQGIAGDKDLCSVYGVVNVSPFAELSLFNPVAFFPPDIMHDVLEGLIVINVGVVIKSLVQEKLLTIKQFNERLANFTFGAIDNSDKFGPLPLDFVGKNKNVSGKAVEKFSLFRLLPLLVADVVPEDARYWQLYTTCRMVCEIILAPVIDVEWIPYLELLISQHHQLLAEIAPRSFTPKVHFVTHYPRLLLAYGPLRHLWTMRFEAVHQYFKDMTRRVKSFKNITLTLAERFQAKKCFESVTNVFALSSTVVKCSQSFVRVTQLPSPLFSLINHQRPATLPLDTKLISVKSISIDGFHFRVDSYVVYDVDDEDMPVFMVIKYILSVDGCWVVCGKVVSVVNFDSHLCAYNVGSHPERPWRIYRTNQSIDCQCFSIYHHNSKKFIFLKHRVVGRKKRELSI